MIVPDASGGVGLERGQQFEHFGGQGFPAFVHDRHLAGFGSASQGLSELVGLNRWQAFLTTQNTGIFLFKYLDQCAQPAQMPASAPDQFTQPAEKLSIVQLDSPVLKIRLY